MTHLGIAITTKDRPEVLLQALRQHLSNMPTQYSRLDNVTWVLVDDGSTPSAREAMIANEIAIENWGGYLVIVRHDEPWGIARSKNHAIDALMDAGCTDLFLFDDDAWPIAPRWAEPYLNHPEGHLQFNYAQGNDHDVELKVLYKDAHTAAFHASRGVMLYFTREVIEKVGGMDPDYEFGFEHVELSERIHNAGFTTWVAQSPRTPKTYAYAKGKPHIVALDETQAVESTITARQRREHTTPNLVLLESHKGRTDFVPYWEPQNLVLTTLFTGIPDPQPDREPWVASGEYARTLLMSLGHRTLVKEDWSVPVVVLHNEDLDDRIGSGVQWSKVDIDPSVNVYVQRWISIRQYLVTHPRVDKVWVTDCSDVEYLQRPKDPFDEVGRDKLYIGFEDKVCGIDWMLDNHPASRAWLTTHSRRPLYNAGVLGGDRDTVLEFIDHLLSAYRRAVVSGEEGEVGDMGFIQQAVGKMGTHRVVTGPHVVSVFKAYQHDNVSALWRHK